MRRPESLHVLWSDFEQSCEAVVMRRPSGDVAIATSFIENRTRAADGSKSSVRAFETDVWQQIDGEWKIISLHYSVVPPS